MAEPSLVRTRTDLLETIGHKAGYGRGVDDWDDDQRRDVEEVLDVALASFYYPYLPDGRQYEWTFMTPDRTLAVASGTRFLDLPDDFAGFVEPSLRLLSGTNTFWHAVPLGASVRGCYAASPDATGAPRHAEVVKAPDQAGRGTRYRLHFFPEADAAYSLEGQMRVSGEALSDRRPYLYGVPAHSFTVHAAALATWEWMMDQVKDGPYQAQYRQRLAASIAQDTALKPKIYGYNRDRSDREHYLHREYDHLGRVGTITIDGLS